MSEEKAKYLTARENYIEFIQYVQPDFIFDPVHKHIAQELDKVVSGETKRLIFLSPLMGTMRELCAIHFRPAASIVIAVV